MLEEISGISSVSGGSLIAALIISRSEMQWPSSVIYRDKIYKQLRTLLTTTDLFSFRAIGYFGIMKYNLRLLNDRASVLADLLRRRWGVVGKLSELPDKPDLWINTTCYETGKNWRFSKREMGDWRFGRHYNPPFDLAEAAAASAAVPYVIGALQLNLPSEGWYRTDPATRLAKEVRTYAFSYSLMGWRRLRKPWPRSNVQTETVIAGLRFLALQRRIGAIGSCRHHVPAEVGKGAACRSKAIRYRQRSNSRVEIAHVLKRH